MCLDGDHTRFDACARNQEHLDDHTLCIYRSSCTFAHRSLGHSPHLVDLLATTMSRLLSYRASSSPIKYTMTIPIFQYHLIAACRCSTHLPKCLSVSDHQHLAPKEQLPRPDVSSKASRRGLSQFALVKRMAGQEELEIRHDKDSCGRLRLPYRASF